MTIELGLFLPTAEAGREVAEAARVAEAAGAGSVWATDHLVASGPMVDSTVALTTAAAVTSRVKVGYGVMLLALRPAAWAAKQVASLQQVSGDRVVLGVGTGNPAHGDVGWRAARVSYADRGRLTDEALEVLPDLVAGRAAVVEDVEVTLAPGAAVPPILVAGAGTKALERAARFGDGWVPIGLPLGEVAGRLELLGELAAKHGRPRPTISIVAPALDADLAKAADQVAAYEQAGVERLILAPTGQGWKQDYGWAGELITSW
ncbi:LLM class flavin-dependent oxidoreductase [Kribbella sp. NPDC051770]|uniref:LLM class flavin-dependent oxidoreductase n=1 Tax=Kribbella sp. NPDC051770 TaxID=3155413 RepID=UPI003438FBB5